VAKKLKIGPKGGAFWPINPHTLLLQRETTDANYRKNNTMTSQLLHCTNCKLCDHID